MFLPLNPRLAIGNPVVTSGRGGVLPPGLAIGTVTSIADGVVTVEPLVDFTRLEYLRLLEYARVLPPERLEELQREIYVAFAARLRAAPRPCRANPLRTHLAPPRRCRRGAGMASEHGP